MMNVILNPIFSWRKFCLYVALSATLVTAGCASVGHEFPAGQVQTIRIGETTQNDIANTFGNPWRTGLESGMKTWTYGNYYVSAFGDNEAEDLVIKFDKRGVVTSYTYNSTKRSK
jgi:outer membrane protein assembly factor BamE (lipoprotein component of BamABCDE complex)